MSKNELTTSDRQSLATLNETQLSDIIKPLSNEIHLFDSFVAGTLQLEDKSVLKGLKVGDKLILQRENSKFDENTINIFTEDKRNIGYVPEKDNVVFARLMDAGKLLNAKIKKIETKGSFMTISIGIYLIDYWICQVNCVSNYFDW